MQDRLMRSRTDRVIGGVCGGLAQYFELDPVIVRLIFVLLGTAGFGFVLYLVLWAIIPSERAAQSSGQYVPPQPVGLPENQPDPLWPSRTVAQSYDPSSFRFDPYTGRPIEPVVQPGPQPGDVAQPTAVASTGPTIDLERQQGAAGPNVVPPVPQVPPIPQVPPVPHVSRPSHHGQTTDRRSQLGILLLIVGALALASQFGLSQFFFPMLLIIGGFMLLTRR